MPRGLLVVAQLQKLLGEVAVDPRGLVTPFFDGWSLDAWIVPESEPALLPSRLPAARQELVMDGSLSVITHSYQAGAALDSSVEVVDEMREKTCRAP